MEISELRLGNYVMDIDNDILPVTNDTFYWISECVRTEDDYKPIELTEDILFKCGFKLAIDENVYTLHDTIELTQTYYGNSFYFMGNFIKSDIKYLHQLQNLYFAITDIELNVSKI